MLQLIDIISQEQQDEFVKTLLLYGWTMASQSGYYRPKSTSNGLQSSTNGTTSSDLQPVISQLAVVQAVPAILETFHKEKSQEEIQEIQEIFDGGAVYTDENYTVPLGAPAYQASSKPFPCDPPAVPKQPKYPWRNGKINSFRPAQEFEQTTNQGEDSFDWASSNEDTKATHASVPIVALVNEVKQKFKQEQNLMITLANGSEMNGENLKQQNNNVMSKFC